MKILPELYI